MEEDHNYATVTFKAKNEVSTFEKPNELEIIYSEVKAEVQTAPTTPKNETKAPLCSQLLLVAAGLGIICVILVSFIITLKIQFQTVMSEQLREISNLTAQNQQLMSEKDVLKTQTQELTRERDGLNWTLKVILEYENFPVKTLCPQKVCKPCLDNWVRFQSNCYLITKHKYSNDWRKWIQSHEECQKFNANLVVIESQEEQEFINNHTEKYHDENHGYWIGLSKKEETGTWSWLDGSNLTVEYWRDQPSNLRWTDCALTSPRGHPLANWQKTSCTMWNRYICETRALTKQDEDPEAIT
ncbi:CD209 antigen-like protein D isoform X2 [Notolabrus celidotus]|uniref:CD209 antigen-like protein D isoform X2 n=1 Tax=Notolabrus celidotus TaxID=1203425 RepID=UPI00148F53A0|nr:CD209 antigen-like protein D isoform X2 [Notolabrus celidotus]